MQPKFNIITKYVEMRLLKTYIACIYIMHQKGLNRDVPYISTLMSIWLVCFLFVADCDSIFRRIWGIRIMPSLPNVPKSELYMIGLPVMLMTFWFMSIFIRRKNIEDTAAMITDHTYRLGKYCHFCIILVELCILFVFVLK